MELLAATVGAKSSIARLPFKGVVTVQASVPALSDKLPVQPGVLVGQKFQQSRAVAEPHALGLSVAVAVTKLFGGRFQRRRAPAAAAGAKKFTLKTENAAVHTSKSGNLQSTIRP